MSPKGIFSRLRNNASAPAHPSRHARPRGWVSIDEYDAAERLGAARLAVPEMMAYAPVAFQRVGYPTRVALEDELLRYADHNFEQEVAGLFRPGCVFRPAAYRNSFSHDESDLLQNIRDRVVGMTSRHFGRPIRPITNLLVQMGAYRIIDAIARRADRRPLSVFEVGPGLGYLGALLIESGYRYASYDITQALCLWQNRLHSWVAAGDFAETLRAEDSTAYSKRIVQVPWWRYIHFRHGTPWKADIVYSNSNLGEMTTVSLQHMLHISRLMLQDSPLGLFMYLSPGSPAVNDEAFVVNQLSGFGFKRVFQRNFDGFVLGDKAVPPTLAALEHEDIPAYDPSGRGGALEASTVMRLSRSEAPLDATISAFLHGWQPPFEE